ncbi:MAG: cytidine deaminase [Lachnospiraceae bacterium]|nr:cytidine deaminase [Lachnospiraceae bacterium]MBQ6637555.1 cytidine deaminase [Lachnospiraceae bacterium]MBR3638352.1 cytidine deaminase [Lachnospiraceae bacterium]
MENREMIRRALEARKSAYCPYSHFAVGACVECEDGSLYDGCNIENASYGACNCAERTAIFKAISEGHTRIVRIAVAGGKEGEDPSEYTYPCGICRQVLFEFGGEKTEVIPVISEEKALKTTMGELLPDAFGPDNLSKETD